MTARFDASIAASVGVLLYLNALQNGLAFDDHRAISRNPCVLSSSPDGVAPGGSGLSAMVASRKFWALLLETDFWGTPLDSPRSHRSYRPLTVLSLRMDVELAQAIANYAAYPFVPERVQASAVAAITHATNALLHGATTGLVWVHAHAGLGGRSTPLMAALLFAVHPVNTEAVVYGVGRADLLAASFGLCGMRLHTRSRWMMASICFVLALAAKETAIVLLLAAAAADVLTVAITSNDCGTAPRARTLARRWIPLGAVLAGFVWLRGVHVGPIVANFRRLDNPIAFAPSRLCRALSTARVHALGFSLLVWPSTLSADYSFDAVPLVSSAHDAANLPSVILYAVLVTLGTHLVRTALIARRSSTHWRATLARANLGWFALLGLSYAPASHVLTPLSFVVAERLLYVPCAAACLLGTGLVHHAVAGGAPLPHRHRGRSRALRWGRRAAVGVALVACGARTARRNVDWRDDDTLFTAAAAAYPRSAKAAYQVADGLVRRRRLDEATPLLRRALEIEPTYHFAYLHFAKMALDDGDAVSALRHARASLAAVPAPNPHGHALAARALLDVRPDAAHGAANQQDTLAQEATEHARNAIAAQPRVSELPQHYTTLAEALSRRRKWPEAASAFEAASRLVPQDAMPHVNVGASLLQMGRAKQAAAHFRHALALASEYRPRTGDGARQREAAERARRGLQIANDALEVVEGP